MTVTAQSVKPIGKKRWRDAVARVTGMEA